MLNTEQLTYKRFWLVLDNIRSAYNVGAIFRTADGTGRFGLILIGITPTPDQNMTKIHKTALGAQQHVPWMYVPDANSFLTDLQKYRETTETAVHLVSLELTSRAESIFRYNIMPNDMYFLVVGHELFGVSAEILVESDIHLYIPMNGYKESLNVAESASIAMYEFYRKQL